MSERRIDGAKLYRTNLVLVGFDISVPSRPHF